MNRRESNEQIDRDAALLVTLPPGAGIGTGATQAPAFGTDATMAGSDATMAPTAAAHAPAVRIAAGGPTRPDYGDLREVDRAHYVIARELARGGMGRILLGRDRRLARSIAIKELLVEDPWLRARFEREVKITARLQHPSIVGVHEAGVWPTGEAFYAMPLVSGRSLDQAIGERTTLQQRMELLPNVIAAVDALAYAHAERVIHRDLKPANVLVGRYGETVVIDWGLAKVLDDPDDTERFDADAGPYRTATVPDHATRAGTVMGTPAYMPVEQARGDSLDARADVFALGAMLYHVLAGVPPYTGASADAILDAVLAGPPPAIASRVTGVPPDLFAIVDKALARDAADRYATATELAADLKRFQTGQLVGAHSYTAWQLVRRWLRRHRTAVIVGAAATAVLAVVGVVSLQRILAEQARTRAQSAISEKNRKQAEDLMGFMLNDLRTKLAPIGKLDVLDAVAAKAVAYYDARGTITDDAESAQRALMLRHVGEVRQGQGKLDEALASLRTSLAMFQELAAKRPADRDRRREVANAFDSLAAALEAKHDPAALPTLEKARDIWKQLVTEDPASDAHQRGLARIELDIGKRLAARSDATALEHETAALAIMKARAAAAPHDATRQADLFDAARSIATLRFDTNDTASAISAQREALALITPIAAADPTNAFRKRDEMLAHYLLGVMLRTQGDVDECVEHLRSATVLATALADRDPTNIDRRRDLASMFLELADTMFSLGDLAEARTHSERAVHEMQTLVGTDPNNADWQIDYARAERALANALLRSRNADAALPHYDQALATLKALSAKDPSDDAMLSSVAMAHQNRTRCLLHLNRFDDAKQAITDALTAQQAVVDKHPKDASLRTDLAVIQQMLGDVLYEQHDNRPALAIYKASVKTREAVLAADPQDIPLALSITMGYERIADTAKALKRRKDRAAALAAARTVAAQLAHDHPDDPRIQGRVDELKTLR